LGRRRRRVVRIVKKKLPSVFVCPRCGEEAVRVTIAKDTGKAVVLCALCNLRDEFPAHPAAQPIDVYSYFTDRFYGVKDPRAIMPREREITHVPMEEEPEEIASPEPPELPTNEEATQSSTSPSELDEPKVEPEGVVADPVESVETLQVPVAEQSKTEEPMADSAETKTEEETAKDEDNEPFADILENKDKKRYSPNPLPQQSSEQTS
jgi:transcription elongation factor Elf1